MNKRIFVSGSVAYDYLMDYDNYFQNAIIPEKLDHLSVCFNPSKRKRHYGGCGGNIVYGLSLFGENPVFFTTAGSDFDEYEKWLEKNNISTEFILRDRHELTACAYILTDKSQNQITIFSGSAMDSDIDINFMADSKNVDRLFKDVGLALLSPDNHRRTVSLAKLLVDRKIPYFFDPGQQLTDYSKERVQFLVENAYGWISNEYEVGLLMKKLEITKEEAIKFFDVFIETLGSHGSRAHVKKENGEYEMLEVPSTLEKAVVDPTGCGDAYRSGVMHGLNSGMSVKDACFLGSQIATCNLENEGTQNHQICF